MPHVTIQDLTQLGDICNSICYHLTAHLVAVNAGVPSTLPPEVAQIYQLAAKLPKPDEKHWAGLMKGKLEGATAAAGAAAGGGSVAKVPGKRLKWTAELEAELIKIVEDEGFRTEKLGKEGTRGGHLNWAAVARHFGFSAPGSVKNKYNELKGLPVDKPAAKKQKEGAEAAPDGQKPAKKAKVAKEEAAAAAPAAEPTPGKKKKKQPEAATAAPASETPATAAAATPAEGWSKQQLQELQQLVEQEGKRKEVLGKKKLKWKRIGEHFGKKGKECRKQYSKATGKEAPEDED